MAQLTYELKKYILCLFPQLFYKSNLHSKTTKIITAKIGTQV